MFVCISTTVFIIVSVSVSVSVPVSVSVSVSVSVFFNYIIAKPLLEKIFLNLFILLNINK